MDGPWAWPRPTGSSASTKSRLLELLALLTLHTLVGAAVLQRTTLGAQLPLPLRAGSCPARARCAMLSPFELRSHTWYGSAQLKRGRSQQPQDRAGVAAPALVDTFDRTP